MNVLGLLHRLAEHLRTGRVFTAGQLAEREGTCVKTIWRYMDFLRYSLDWEIESGSRKGVSGKGIKGYRLLKEGTRLLNDIGSAKR